MQLQQLRTMLRDVDTASFVDAWLRWRGSRLLPRRGDMDLHDIARNLPTIALLEVLGPDNILVRLAGTRLRFLSGFEATGRNYKEFTPPADWPARSQRYLEMVGRPCGTYNTVHFELPQGPVLVFEGLNLPIDADEPGRPRQILCCLTPLDKLYRPPNPAVQSYIPASDDLVFVDIGAGVPDGAGCEPGRV